MVSIIIDKGKQPTGEHLEIDYNCVPDEVGNVIEHFLEVYAIPYENLRKKIGFDIGKKDKEE